MAVSEEVRTEHQQSRRVMGVYEFSEEEVGKGQGRDTVIDVSVKVYGPRT